MFYKVIYVDNSGCILEREEDDLSPKLTKSIAWDYGVTKTFKLSRTNYVPITGDIRYIIYEEI